MLSLLSLIIVSQTASAAPEAKLIDFWLDHAENNTIDHQAWQSLLDEYLVAGNNGVNLFKYGAVSNSDHKALKAYLTTLQAIDPRQYDRAEQMAYWINLYNALTIDVVLDAYPTKSILKIGGSFFSPGPWNKKYLKIAGQKLSLNDIEHGILRPIWQDSRIHYVVNCASYSCPNLSAIAYTAENTDEQLTTAAKDYINNPRGVTVDGEDLLLSKIFDWYQVDFGNNEKELLEQLANHAEPELAKRLLNHDGDIDYDYDWSLNEAK
ncbi:MAG: DUF547 domain-containing protein [Gammaproteobacteria bacterium]|nr:DUF547 domain-containing protein [Gammaproteobacteria bacterium]